MAKMKNLWEKIVFLQVSHPASNSTKIKVVQVTYYNLTLDPPRRNGSRVE